MIHDLNALTVFVAVAETLSFRAAGSRLGISTSAVSQSVRKFEAQVGTLLLQRTTRSVRLTESGERLYAELRPALATVDSAIAATRAMSGEPRGRLRLLIGTAVEPVLARLPLAEFLRTHPHVSLEVVVREAVADIIGAGFDAAIQLGEVIERDMLALPITGDIRMTVVGAPSYFAQHAPPQHPRDLLVHECLNWHPTREAAPYRWEFTEGGRDLTIAAPGRVLSTDSAVNIRLARDGMGLAIVYEDQVRDEVARGDLVPVLQAFCEPFPGYFLCYPHHTQHAAPLHALIEFLRARHVRIEKAHSTLGDSA